MERLQTIEGVVLKPTRLPPGCHFEPRCPYRLPRCGEGEIELYRVAEVATVRCVLYDPAVWDVINKPESLHQKNEP